MAADAEKIVRANAPAVQQPVIEMPSEKLATREVDGALAFLRNEADASIAELDEKKLVRRIDWLIMPMLFGVYVLQYIDKSLSMSLAAPSMHPMLYYRDLRIKLTLFIVNYANVMGISKDTHMTAAQFSYLATFFYVTFAVFQPVHAYLMQKFPTAQYLGVNVALWGVTLAGMLCSSLTHAWMYVGSLTLVEL